MKYLAIIIMLVFAAPTHARDYWTAESLHRYRQQLVRRDAAYSAYIRHLKRQRAIACEFYRCKWR